MRPTVVRIFLPDDLLLSCLDTDVFPPRGDRRTLLGWVHSTDDNEDPILIVVVAGLLLKNSSDEARTPAAGENNRVPPLQNLGSLILPSALEIQDQDEEIESSAQDGRQDKGKSRARDDGKPAFEMVLRLDTPNYAQTRTSLWQGRKSKRRPEFNIVQLKLKGHNLLPNWPPTPIQLFHYRTPRPESLQYLSLHPVAPPPPGAPGLELLSSTRPRTTRRSKAREDGGMLQRALEASVAADPLRGVEVGGGKGSRVHLRLAVDLINEASASLQAHHERVADDGTDRTTPSRTRVHMHERITPIWDRAFGPVYHCTISIAIHAILALRYLLSTPWIPLPFHGKNTRSLGLIDIFATAHQLHIRSGQLLVWPLLSRKLRTLRIARTLPTRLISPSYMSVWNGIWLVANDLILGRAMGQFLRANKDVIAHWISGWLLGRTVADVQALLDWLGNWPGGLKLNTELARFFGDLYAGTTQLWSEVVLQDRASSGGTGIGLGLGTPANLARLIDVIGFCGQWAGLTLILALSADVLVLCTFHLHIAYLLSRAIYAWFLYGLDVLFHVFRGKKRNTLRGGRVDDAEYELDQRLLGTILFTLLVFLFPTVGVYYLPFAMAEWMRVGVRAGVLEVGLALLNHLPLFGLMLRLKDPARVPAGIQLEPEDNSPAATTSQQQREEEETGRYIQEYRIRSVPASLHQIFHGYAVHFGQARQMPGLLLNILTGRHIEVIGSERLA
ncbi:unnamed protein product [Tilletia caries]|uniref:Gpi1-domain-containing protein n=3 Tax=Tilletia TaxID=13289 RepID=A0A8X7MT46_9BASI|nr:hypothetical protein CF336_g4361 [Tilletia laevis]KAE8196762.1 hypothetical protein CF328_g4045 [Tilletia controversa]KAE8260883.1 hypothetical protein A4X03_0g3681 [Tilletia caries]KAE8202466.1 hypothetical protein CF335_g3406 [Tilletia laevis]KAE8246963.1 hypothetical protein A4X06_0g4797 [Tilletia controversa]